MAILHVVQVAKEFAERTLFSDISFEVAPRDRVGLIGVNGCGKSTLLQIIEGRIRPDAGYVALGPECHMAAVEQLPKLSHEVSLMDFVLKAYGQLLAWEEELQGLSTRLETAAEEERLRLINRQDRLTEQFHREGGLTFRSITRSTLLGLGFTEGELSKPIAEFSGGQVSKAMLARAILRKADLLLLDEPTNNLDVGAITFLQEYLTNYKGAYILVSHDRAFLDAATDRILELENGHLIATRGNYSRHVELKMDQRQRAQREYQRTLKEIKRIEGVIEQQRRWNQARNYVTIASKQKQIDRLKEGLVKPEKDPAAIHFHFRGAEPSGNEILDVRDLGLSYGSHRVFSHANLLLLKGETLCLVGANGCGKSSFLKAIVGELMPSQGHFRLGAGVRLGYFQQNTDNLTPSFTILEQMQDFFPHSTEGELRNYLGAFLFRGDDIYKLVGTLSGGERARLKLLQLVLGGANVLLLDEPTNHFDIQSCEVLEAALEAFGGTVLIVTHDRYLVERLADRVVLLNSEGMVELNQEEAFSSLAQPQQKEQSPDNTDKKDNYYQRQKESKAALLAAKQEITRAEKAIEANEAAALAAQDALEAAQIKGDFAQMQALCRELERLSEQEEALYEALEQAENNKLRLQKEIEG